MYLLSPSPLWLKGGGEEWRDNSPPSCVWSEERGLARQQWRVGWKEVVWPVTSYISIDNQHMHMWQKIKQDNELHIGIIRGNPGVFYLYPYPTHWKSLPSSRVRVFVGLGKGFWRPKGLPYYWGCKGRGFSLMWPPVSLWSHLAFWLSTFMLYLISLK